MFEYRDYIGNEYIKGFLQGAIRSGHDPHEILRDAGLPPDIYEDPDSQLDGRELYSLIRAIKEATNDIYLGFLASPAKLPMEVEMIKHALVCETLGEALKGLSQFIENFRNDFNYIYFHDKKTSEFSLRLNYQVTEGVDSHFFHLYRISNAYRFYSWLIGNRIKLTRVCFPEPRPGYCFDYRLLFHCESEFRQPECRLCFDEKYLRAKVVRSEAELNEYLNRYSDWLSVPGHERSLSSQIEQILTEKQRESGFLPTVEAVSETLSINPRTIRRMLERENESYQKIKSRVRRELALKLLLTTEIPLAIVAEKVGFTEPAAFSRAFLQWTGATPSTYRAAYAGENDNAHRG
ncbi:AraC family transcriptional regulator ligand-binding domain-containing protein [Sedimenticola sp.]|uniref:AraC family transcriptional regulator n=1 Tax=Sedimenticola sp. TaxID=1940285 RepID=UPI003D0B00C6